MTLCGFAFGVGVAGAGIAVLSLFDLIRHVEGWLRSLLSLVREHLARFQHGAREGGRDLVRGLVLLSAAFAMLVAVAVLAAFMATSFHPSALYHTPKYGLYALLPGAAFGVALLFRPFRTSVAGFLRSDPDFSEAFGLNLACYYLSVVAALTVPFLLFSYAGYQVPYDFVFYMLVLPMLFFLPYLIGTGWFYVLWSLLGAVFYLVLLFFYVFSLLASHPRGAIGLISILMGLFGFGVRYFELCG